MKHEEFRSRTHFTKLELVANSQGRLVEDPPSPDFGALPSPPFLMVDRVLDIRHDGPRGSLVAEQDVAFDAWYFQCHFRADPVQPGALGVDAVWQLLGLYCAVRGARGTGRALGCKEVEFFGQIRPHDKVVRYELDIRRYTELQGGDVALVIGSARVLVDGKPIYRVDQAKVGMFAGIRYADYPWPSESSTGGPREYPA